MSINTFFGDLLKRNSKCFCFKRKIVLDTFQSKFMSYEIWYGVGMESSAVMLVLPIVSLPFEMRFAFYYIVNYNS